jgi:hypothetical protein
MKTRFLRPSFAFNEDLAALGPYATLLYERLIMMADSAGRLEYRPIRIAAEAFPYWPEQDAAAVEILVENLCKTQLLHLYSVGYGGRKLYLQVQNFHLEQRPYHREPASVIPEAPQLRAANNRRTKAKRAEKSVGSSVGSSVGPPSAPRRAPRSLLFTSKEEVLRRRGECEGGENETPPPPDEIHRSHEHAPEPPPPAGSPDELLSDAPPPRNFAAERKPPASETADDSEGSPLALVRDSMLELGRLAGLPPPDAAIVRQVLAAGDGDGETIHRTLVALHKRGRFRSMRSWGLLPVVIRGTVRGVA